MALLAGKIKLKHLLLQQYNLQQPDIFCERFGAEKHENCIKVFLLEGW